MEAGLVAGLLIAVPACVFLCSACVGFSLGRRAVFRGAGLQYPSYPELK